MKRTHVIAVVIAVVLATALAACSSPWLGADAKIHVGGSPAVIPSEQIPQLRGLWSPESVAVARTSGFSESYWLSAMDLVARMSSSATTPCKRLQLLAVTQMPANEFELNRGDGPKQTVVPTRVEEWRVDTCGTQSVLRVFDDKLKPDMKVGVTRLGAR